jgi:hypothetical protein
MAFVWQKDGLDAWIESVLSNRVSRTDADWKEIMSELAAIPFVDVEVKFILVESADRKTQLEPTYQETLGPEEASDLRILRDYLLRTWCESRIAEGRNRPSWSLAAWDERVRLFTDKEGLSRILSTSTLKANIRKMSLVMQAGRLTLFCHLPLKQNPPLWAAPSRKHVFSVDEFENMDAVAVDDYRSVDDPRLPKRRRFASE